MKTIRWPLALALSLSSMPVCAQDMDDGEDPFAEGERDDDKDGREDSDGSDSEYIDEEAPRTFGRAGSVAISVERLLGVASTTQEVEVEGAPDLEENVTRVHVLQNSGGPDYLGYSTPRIAFDLFVSDGFSIGLAAGYSADSGGYDYRQFTVGGRVGYALMFGKVGGIWGRVGASYQDHAADLPAPSAKLALLAATADVQLVLVPVKHVAVLVGPRLDLGIIGKLDAEGRDKVDATAREVGFSAGFGIFF